MKCVYMNARYHASLLVFSRHDDHIELVKGNSYAICVRQRSFGRIEVHACAGYEMRKIEGTTIFYMDLRSFFMDWQPGNLLPDPGDDWNYKNKEASAHE